jgi:hypothetical protein
MNFVMKIINAEPLLIILIEDTKRNIYNQSFFRKKREVI